MTDFTMKTDADGVALITWDVPGKSMNVLSEAGIRELDAQFGLNIAGTLFDRIEATSAA